MSQVVCGVFMGIKLVVLMVMVQRENHLSMKQTE